MVFVINFIYTVGYTIEAGFDVDVILCANFQEPKSFLGCKIFTHLICYLFVRQVAFIGQQHDHNALVWMIYQLLVPRL